MDGRFATRHVTGFRRFLRMRINTKEHITFFVHKSAHRKSMSNEMRLYTVYLLLQTALHISGGDTTHHQEHI